MRFGRRDWRVVSGERRAEPGAQATGVFSRHLTPNTQHLSPLFRTLALVALTVSCFLFPIRSLAQTSAYNLGKTATPDEVKAWDISIGPEGKELPPGSGTAKQGAKIYAQKCAQCHGKTGTELNTAFPGYNRPLVGGIGTLTNVRPVMSIGSYWPFATALWDWINRSMPLYPIPLGTYGVYAAEELSPSGLHGMKQGPPDAMTYAYDTKDGSLSADEVYALTAFLLFQNGIIKENDVMDAKSLPKVQMPNRHGFLPAEPADWKPGVRLEPHIAPHTP